EDMVEGVRLVLDGIGGDTLNRSWKVLQRGGVLVSIVQVPNQEQAASRGVRGVFFIVRPNRAQLIEIGQAIDSGSLQPIIASTLPLARAREAFEMRRARGHIRGKIVLKVAG